MACGMLNPRYWPGLEEERVAETEEGALEAVVATEEASLLSQLASSPLTPVIELPDGRVGDIDVDAVAAAAEPPAGDTLPPAGIRADETADPSTAGGGAGGGAPPPAA